MAALGRIVAALVVGLVCLAPTLVYAHDLRPGAVALREVEPGRFAVRLTPPQDGSEGRFVLAPELPDGCAYGVDGVVCQGRLAGELRIPALAERRVKVVVHITWLDGRSWQGMLREGESRVVVDPSPEGAGPFIDYLRLGIEHLLFGVDHLLFVLGLALVAGDPRRVTVAATGFTVAHSLTLAAAALGLLVAPPAATELVIAASILLLAAEATHDRPTWTRQYPWAVAFVFGLVHGFGFAGALAELGLPSGGALLALLAFNLGVEVGQLAVLALAFGAVAALRRVASPRQLELARGWAPYALGLPAGLWVVERAAIWWAGLA